MQSTLVLKMWFISILQSLFLFFSPIFAVVFLVGFMALIDTCFGIAVARRKKLFTSRKLRLGFMPKVFGYSLAILLVYAIDFHILNSLINSIISVEYLSTKVTSLVFIVIETKSIDENYARLYGYSMLDKAKKIVKSIKTVKDSIKD